MGVREENTANLGDLEEMAGCIGPTLACLLQVSRCVGSPLGQLGCYSSNACTVCGKLQKQKEKILNHWLFPFPLLRVSQTGALEDSKFHFIPEEVQIRLGRTFQARRQVCAKRTLHGLRTF